MNATEASKESEKKVVLPDLDDDDAVVEVDGKSCPLLPFFADISENNAYFICHLDHHHSRTSLRIPLRPSSSAPTRHHYSLRRPDQTRLVRQAPSSICPPLPLLRPELAHTFLLSIGVVIFPFLFDITLFFAVQPLSARRGQCWHASRACQPAFRAGGLRDEPGAWRDPRRRGGRGGGGRRRRYGQSSERREEEPKVHRFFTRRSRRLSPRSGLERQVRFDLIARLLPSTSLSSSLHQIGRRRETSFPDLLLLQTSHGIVLLPL
jgi:hypothetical protein